MGFYDRSIGNLTFQTSSQLEELGVRHGFTNRLGGVSEGIFSSLNLGLHTSGDDPEKVRENYRRVCDALGVDISKVVFSKQVHADNIREVTEDDLGKGLDKPIDYETDGLVTNVKGAVLAVFGADCLTAVLYDPVCVAAAAVHAGWRGTAAGIIGKAVKKMKDLYDCDAQNIRAALGPCISRCCFETGADVKDAMIEAYGDKALPYIDEKENGKFMADLKGLNKMQLEKEGILHEHIDVSFNCTMCNPDKYWSHRITQGRRGIQAGLIEV